MNKNLFILALLLLPIVHKAQTSLVSGDIAFVAINSDGGTDDFSFLLLRDIESGTSINFTDNGWTAAGAFNRVYAESHITWTAYEKIKAGTIIQIKTYNGNELAISSDGKITGDKMTVSVAGDQILAYQGDKAKPRFIAAISFNQNIDKESGDDFDGDSYSNSTTAMPPGLTKGLNAIHIYLPKKFVERDNSIYNCTVTNGEKNDLLHAVNDVSNWIFHDDEPFKQEPFPCEFKVDTPTDIAKQSNGDLRVFPNPAAGFIRVSAQTNSESRILVINTAGIILNEFLYPANTAEQTYNIHHLPPGIYYIKMRIDDSDLTTKISVVN